MIFAGIDFSIPAAAGSALIAGVPLPLYLAIVAHIPGFRGRNALQFLVALCAMMAIWSGSIVFAVEKTSPVDIAVSMMILGAGALVYLEVWALLSRGYTLGLLLTLYRARKPLSEQELAASYRSGEGISWIMNHRLSGLTAAGLVTIRGGRVALTPVLGATVAWIYQIAVTILGLRKSG